MVLMSWKQITTRSLVCFKNSTPRDEMLRPMTGRTRAYCVDCLRRAMACAGMVVAPSSDILIAVEPIDDKNVSSSEHHAVMNSQCRPVGDNTEQGWG